MAIYDVLPHETKYPMPDCIAPPMAENIFEFNPLGGVKICWVIIPKSGPFARGKTIPCEDTPDLG
jgi:hypothetical protein